MSQEKKNILVTWDFSEPAVNAMKHGAKIGKIVENNVYLFHVVQEEAILKETEAKLKEACSKYSEELGHKIEYILKIGSIFDEISDFASEENNLVNFVILGTHGMKGGQKIFGSKALRVISGSTVPFLVIQKAPDVDRYLNIVFPIDYKSENKEKLQWAIFLGKHLNSKIHIYKTPSKDKSLMKKVNVNMNFAIRFLIQNNIEYEIHESGPNNKNYVKDMLAYSRSVSADFILITTTKHLTKLDLMFSAKEQYIIANEDGIPVMCVNPRASFATVGQFMYG